MLKRYSTLILIFLLGTALSLLMARSIHTHEVEKQQLIFRQHAAEMINSFQSTLDQHLYILTAIDAFFASSQSVDRDEFKVFTLPFLTKDPEIKNLQWIPQVASADREKFEADAQNEAPGYEFKKLDQDGRLIRDTERSEYFPVHYVEPIQINRPVLGYDHASDGVRLEAIRKARDTEQLVVTPGIVAENGRSIEPSSVLILKPFVRYSDTSSDPASKRKFEGIITGVFNIEDIWQTAMTGFESPGLTFTLKDVTPRSTRTVLFDRGGEAAGKKGGERSRPNLTNDPWALVREFDFCDRKWSLEIVSADRPEMFGNKIALTAFVLGVLLTLMLEAYLFLLIRNGARQEEAAAANLRSAEALRASEERSRSIVETANDAFFTINAEGIVEDMNHKAEALFGWTKEEIVGNKLSDKIIPEKYRSAHRDGIKKYVETGIGPVINQRIEITAMSRTRGEFPVELTIWPVKRGGGVIFSGFVHDISDRKAAEERIKRNEQHIRLLQDISSAANQAESSEEVLKICLSKVCDLMGWSVGHVYVQSGSDPATLVSSKIWHMSDPELFGDFKRVSEEMEFRAGTGLPGRVLESRQPLWIRDVGEDANFPRAKAVKSLRVKGAVGFPVMKKDEVVAVIEFFSSKPEESSPEILEIMAQIGNQLGRVIEREQGARLLKDALEKAQKANEDLKRTQSQLIQADRLSAIGQLAAGVAHEINNPIGFVNSNLSTLNKYGTSLALYQETVQRLLAAIKENRDPEGAINIADEVLALGEKIKVGFIFSDMGPLIQESQSGLDRVKKIVLDLKTFVRADSKEGMDLIDLNDALAGTVNVVWNELKYKVTLVKELGDIPKVYCNGQQMGQVFMNMLVNGAQAIKEAGTITLRTYVKEYSVCVDIEDTGEGIPSDVMDHIFDPFFTTKEVGQGTGLGLGISYDIVKKHGGRIEVRSTVGQGTKFTVLLPLLSCPMPQPTPKTSA